jgi:ATP-binding cassette subfamily B multidrug efflux pump
MTSPDKAKRSDTRMTFAAAKRLFSYIGAKYRIQFVFVIVFIVISTLASVIGTLFIQTLIDDYITPLMSSSSPDFSGLLKAVTVMGFIYLAGILATLFYNRMMVAISQGVQKNIRDQLFSHMQSLPIRFFDTHKFGDLMSVYTNDVDTLRQLFSQSIPQLFSSAVTILFVFVAMLTVSWHLAILVVALLVVMLLVAKNVSGKSGKYFMQQQQDLGKQNGYIEEMMNGQKVIKVFNHERKAEEQFDGLNEQLRDSATKANTYANILMPIMANIGNLQYVLIAIVGGILALSGVGTLTLGAIASFLQLSRSFTMPVSQISMQLNSVVMALAGAARIFTLMDEQPEQDDGYVTLVNATYDENNEIYECDYHSGIWAWKHPHNDGSITYTPLKGEVEFFDVDFGYTDDKIVLHNITLDANAGEKLAFVGATGAGKTTITNLINRFYDVQDGKIRYDGININKIKKADLRHSLGIVLQDTHLFSGTIMENLRYGRLTANDEEVRAAAQLAGADSFISRLPDGYQTEIEGDGGNLSQGQRQLLAVARAAVADPPVMILDEATSVIDTRTEAIVQKGMDALMHGRTVFVIAHRLSTVKNADEIMVMDGGRIIEQGTHKELIAQKGRYYQLYTGAFELE